MMRAQAIEIRKEKTKKVRELRDGVPQRSFKSIGDELGVSKQRAHQLYLESQYEYAKAAPSYMDYVRHRKHKDKVASGNLKRGLYKPCMYCEEKK